FFSHSFFLKCRGGSKSPRLMECLSIRHETAQYHFGTGLKSYWDRNLLRLACRTLADIGSLLTTPLYLYPRHSQVVVPLLTAPFSLRPRLSRVAVPLLTAPFSLRPRLSRVVVPLR